MHIWEYNVVLACQHIQLGVYNPSTRKEHYVQLKTKTPRVITFKLDCEAKTLDIWLNWRHKIAKKIKLDKEGGPFIPCVKMSMERNKIIINPFAKIPEDPKPVSLHLIPKEQWQYARY